MISRTDGTKTLPDELLLPIFNSLRAHPTEFLKPEDCEGLFFAGKTGYEKIFFRDTAIAASLAQDPQMLRSILHFGAKRQGQKKNPATGEQPGAIFHEFNPMTGEGGIMVNNKANLTTEYNASDTAALFLLGHVEYQSLTGDTSLAASQEENIRKAALYKISHLGPRGHFEEDPSFADASDYALNVTFWKDSMLHDRPGGKPAYPVVYSLLHIQNLAGIRAAIKLIGGDLIVGGMSLSRVAEKMQTGLSSLFSSVTGTFIIGYDRAGELSGVSSDSLHALDFLEPGDITKEQLMTIIEASMVLETTLGYRTFEPELSKDMGIDGYHMRTVWTHEQAIIHRGATKHLAYFGEHEPHLGAALHHVQDVSSRMYHNYLKIYPVDNHELFYIQEDGSLTPSGCNPQLWAVAARMYFERALKDRKEDTIVIRVGNN